MFRLIYIFCNENNSAEKRLLIYIYIYIYRSIIPNRLRSRLSQPASGVREIRNWLDLTILSIFLLAYERTSFLLSRCGWCSCAVSWQTSVDSSPFRLTARGVCCLASGHIKFPRRLHSEIRKEILTTTNSSRHLRWRDEFVVVKYIFSELIDGSTAFLKSFSGCRFSNFLGVFVNVCYIAGNVNG